MNFPFVTSYKRNLRVQITTDNTEQILHFIAKNILADKADNVVVKDMSVCYKGSTSNWRGSLFGTTDKGIFHLIYQNNSWSLKYTIYMYKLFTYTAIMSFVLGVIAFFTNGPWWIGIAAFLWLCGANWIINIFRHGLKATDIATEIDILIDTKSKTLVEENKMTGKLKSWF